MRHLTVDLPAPPAPDVPGTLDGSLLAALRAATRAAHERLEAGLPLTHPGLTLEAYRGIVEAFYGFYAPLEARLARLAEGSASGLPIHGREKLGRLRADLTALGATEARIDVLPLCAAIPDVSTPGAAFGCLYVVEGATLGGRVIVRSLRDRLRLGPTTGAAFFDGYGVDTGPMWASFCVQLAASPWERAETLAAAVATFVELERWLRQRGALR
jgi:heme oxygenase (biliverdin-IX-beta and delta-forming)